MEYNVAPAWPCMYWWITHSASWINLTNRPMKFLVDEEKNHALYKNIDLKLYMHRQNETERDIVKMMNALFSENIYLFSSSILISRKQKTYSNDYGKGPHVLFNFFWKPDFKWFNWLCIIIMVVILYCENIRKHTILKLSTVVMLWVLLV